MKKQLEQYFGCEIKIVDYKEKVSLPIFMAMRDIKIIELYGVHFAVVDISKEAELTIAVMKKQKMKYEEALQCPVAYVVDTNSMAMRNALVKNGIAFIDLPENVFLPFAGIILQDIYRKQSIRTDKMMPATQLVFLELFYMKDGEAALKSEIAYKLNLTKTSITRATAQLEAMGLIEQSKSGKEIFVRRNYSRKEYYKKAQKYLINPIQKTVTIVGEGSVWRMWRAGESALSKLSQLNPPRVEEVAIYKGEEIVDQFEIVDERYTEYEGFLRVQLWKYNPSYFASNGNVDPISLICTFMNNEDERIEMCIEELLEEF